MKHLFSKGETITKLNFLSYNEVKISMLEQSKYMCECFYLPILVQQNIILDATTIYIIARSFSSLQ